MLPVSRVVLLLVGSCLPWLPSYAQQPASTQPQDYLASPCLASEQQLLPCVLSATAQLPHDEPYLATLNSLLRAQLLAQAGFNAAALLQLQDFEQLLLMPNTEVSTLSKQLLLGDAGVLYQQLGESSRENIVHYLLLNEFAETDRWHMQDLAAQRYLKKLIDLQRYDEAFEQLKQLNGVAVVRYASEIAKGYIAQGEMQKAGLVQMAVAQGANSVGDFESWSGLAQIAAAKKDAVAHVALQRAEQALEQLNYDGRIDPQEFDVISEEMRKRSDGPIYQLTVAEELDWINTRLQVWLAFGEYAKTAPLLQRLDELELPYEGMRFPVDLLIASDYLARDKTDLAQQQLTRYWQNNELAAFELEQLAALLLKLYDYDQLVSEHKLSTRLTLTVHYQQMKSLLAAQQVNAAQQVHRQALLSIAQLSDDEVTPVVLLQVKGSLLFEWAQQAYQQALPLEGYQAAILQSLGLPPQDVAQVALVSYGQPALCPQQAAFDCTLSWAQQEQASLAQTATLLYGTRWLLEQGQQAAAQPLLELLQRRRVELEQQQLPERWATFMAMELPPLLIKNGQADQAMAYWHQLRQDSAGYLLAGIESMLFYQLLDAGELAYAMDLWPLNHSKLEESQMDSLALLLQLAKQQGKTQQLELLLSWRWPEDDPRWGEGLSAQASQAQLLMAAGDYQQAWPLLQPVIDQLQQSEDWYLQFELSDPVFRALAYSDKPQLGLPLIKHLLAQPQVYLYQNMQPTAVSRWMVAMLASGESSPVAELLFERLSAEQVLVGVDFDLTIAEMAQLRDTIVQQAPAQQAGIWLNSLYNHDPLERTKAQLLLLAKLPVEQRKNAYFQQLMDSVCYGDCPITFAHYAYVTAAYQQSGLPADSLLMLFALQWQRLSFEALALEAQQE